MVPLVYARKPAATHKTPTPKHTTKNNADDTTQPTMGRSDRTGRSGDDDHRDGDDDRSGGNVGRQSDDAIRRTSKRNAPSTGTPVKKKTKKAPNETPTGSKRNNGDNNDAISPGGATDEKAVEDGISVEDKNNATDNNVEVKGNNNNLVSQPGFSCLK